MNIKLASVFLLFTLVVSSYGFFVIETYADANCNETIIARSITNDNSNCASALSSVCFPTKLGIYYTFDTSYCASATEPELPTEWQSVTVVGSDSSCSTTASNYSKIQAPQSLQDAFVFFYDTMTHNKILANISMACNTVNGAVSFSFCYYPQFQVQTCFNFALETNVCTIDSGNSTYDIQSTCVAPPMAAPVASNGPASGPIVTPVVTPTAPSTAPTKVPLKAPTAKTSNAELIVGSFSLLTIFALI